MKRIHLSAILLGLIVYLGVYALRAAFGDHLVAWGLLEQHGPGGLVPLTWLSALVWVLPPFVAGWAARRYGGAHGLLTAALGISLEFWITAMQDGMVRSSRLWNSGFDLLTGWVELLGVAVILGLVAGIAGMAVAQRR